ncbi:hypothetical protein CPB84DRAFT_1812952 [Gymnopilus junonius]|uniref:Uncharacterized protein n=1 Tax=Gymnopilus junonius TaxID=109634 RepID=A0A9P5NZ36_GYMJU|nr:hypothetical protein CPB84DRAFT_1812952 [Gymnopilus junonius]
MATSPSNRSVQSNSGNLQAPAQGSSTNFKQQRRMTSPAGFNLAPPSDGRKPSSRPPSPLRNGFVLNSSTGIDPDDESDEEDEDDGVIAPKSPGMLSDAELEAEAERERERGRREAEAILTREAQQRRLLEDRVLEVMETTRSLPPPPSRSQTLPNPPSPSNSQKDPSWWQAAKNRLTPSKEPLTLLSNDPAYANLYVPVTPPTRKPVPSASDSLASSPSREAPPLYAQFNAQGTLDVPGTLLTIAKRFEKLEKWTVGHVRALEERMNDVERWLVDKETKKEEIPSTKETKAAKSHPEVEHDLQDMREEISELQGRVGELGREMAKLATAPSRLASGPNPQTASVTSGHQQMLVEQLTGGSLSGTPHLRRMSSTALESTSPPLVSNKTPSGTRLPYPQGDYTSPPDACSGCCPTPSGNGLPPPKQSSKRQTSVSPTPRKRYTVALGGPIVAPDELSSNAAIPAAAEPQPPVQHGSTVDDDDDDDEENEFAGETIGKSAASKLASSGLFSGGPGMGDYKLATPNTAPATTTSPSSLSNRRLRAQSAYGFSSIPGSGNTTTEAALSTPSVAPLRLKARSKSTERLSTGSGTGDGMVSALAGPGQNKFVDPLVLRKQSKEALTKPIAMPRPVGKVPVGQLVAFFDGEVKK